MLLLFLPRNTSPPQASSWRAEPQSPGRLQTLWLFLVPLLPSPRCTRSSGLPVPRDFPLPRIDLPGLLPQIPWKPLGRGSPAGRDTARVSSDPVLISGLLPVDDSLRPPPLRKPSEWRWLGWGAGGETGRGARRLRRPWAPRCSHLLICSGHLARGSGNSR